MPNKNKKMKNYKKDTNKSYSSKPTKGNKNAKPLKKGKKYVKN